MTTNKPNVKRYDNMGCPEEICRVDTMYGSDDGDYVLWEDYEQLLRRAEELAAEIERLQAENGQGIEQKPVPDVTQLVEALERMRLDEILSAYRENS